MANAFNRWPDLTKYEIDLLQCVLRSDYCTKSSFNMMTYGDLTIEKTPIIQKTHIIHKMYITNILHAKPEKRDFDYYERLSKTNEYHDYFLKVLSVLGPIQVIYFLDRWGGKFRSIYTNKFPPNLRRGDFVKISAKILNLLDDDYVNFDESIEAVEWLRPEI